MSDANQVRALLSAFTASSWRELHLRSADWTLWLAKPGAGANPLHAAAPAAEPAETITAPHLGTFVPRASAGQRVAAGETIGTLMVLDRETVVAASVAGTLSALPADGTLVEYGQTLAAIAA